MTLKYQMNRVPTCLDESGTEIECNNPRDIFLYCDKCNRPVMITVGCHSRFKCVCPPCSDHYLRKTKKRFAEIVKAMKSPKLVTLTLDKKNEDLPSRFKTLWAMKSRLFFYLKRRGYKIGYWVGAIELPNHVHLVIDSEYIPQHELSEVWQLATGDSFVVDIRKVWNYKKAVKYIVKYITKTITENANIDYFSGLKIINSYAPNLIPKSVFQCDFCYHSACYKKIDVDGFFAILRWFQEIHSTFEGDPTRFN